MEPSSKDLKKLQKLWYDKLKKEGFDDIEQDENYLKRWDSHWFNSQYSPEYFQNKAEYYRAAGKFLYEHQFKSELERQIWAKHAEGLTIRDIVTVLRKARFKLYRRMVHETIQRLTKTMIENLGNSSG